MLDITVYYAVFRENRENQKNMKCCLGSKYTSDQTIFVK